MREKVKIKVNPFHQLFFRFLKNEGLYGSLKTDKLVKNIYPSDLMQLCNIPIKLKREVNKEWKKVANKQLNFVIGMLFRDFLNGNEQLNRTFQSYLKRNNVALSDFLNARVECGWEYPLTRPYNRNYKWEEYSFDYEWSRNYRKKLFALLNSKEWYEKFN